MNRTLLLMAVAAVATSGVKAQSVTYNHDSPKQNQITVMETGTGALSPELYYTLLHNKYKKSAASKNKLGAAGVTKSFCPCRKTGGNMGFRWFPFCMCCTVMWFALV